MAKPLATLALSLMAVWAAVWLAHWPLLHLPYYWDEAGYYIPAAYDFFRRGTLIPYSTLSNAHPPLPSLYLAGCWRVFGFSPFVTRSAMCLAAALGLLAVYRLGCTALCDRRAAVAAAVLTAVYPVWFVQSSLAHADVLAAAGTLWGLVFYLRSCDGNGGRARTLAGAASCFALAALAKEIAIGTPLALGCWELWLAARDRNRGHVASMLALSAPALPLAAWFAYHRWRTGFTFGNPEYLRYNATATLTPVRVALALGHRALHLTAHLNLFVPVTVTLVCLLLPRMQGTEPEPIGRSYFRSRFLVVLAANWIFFSVLGGALLTRYLLPLYPLVLILCVHVWRSRLRRWGWVALLTAAAFLLGLFVNPPYRFAPEDTLAYRDSILLEQHGIAQIEARYSHPTVLTAWPATDGLTKPELGYVTTPLPVIAIDSFSYPQVRLAQQKAAEESVSPIDGRPAAPYTVALVFSTKYDPPGLLDGLAGPLAARRRALDERYFGLHADLSPQAIATLLEGSIVWQEERHGQWAAVLHFSRPQLALFEPPETATPPASQSLFDQHAPQL